jgi:hypothetical protein
MIPPLTSAMTRARLPPLIRVAAYAIVRCGERSAAVPVHRVAIRRYGIEERCPSAGCTTSRRDRVYLTSGQHGVFHGTWVNMLNEVFTMKAIFRTISTTLVVCAAVSGCMPSDEELGASIQEVYTINNGIECYVDTPSEDVFTVNNCQGSWTGGPSYSLVTFRLRTVILALLGDGSSPAFSWSDSRCPSNPYEYCTLPIKRGQPLNLRALLTSQLDGSLIYESRVRALYY